MDGVDGVGPEIPYAVTLSNLPREPKTIAGYAMQVFAQVNDTRRSSLECKGFPPVRDPSTWDYYVQCWYQISSKCR